MTDREWRIIGDSEPQREPVTDEWRDFLRAHGRVVAVEIGGGAVLPVNARSLRLLDDIAAREGRAPFPRIYVPSTEEVAG